MDATLPDWRRHKLSGTPGAKSVGSLGSLHGSPATSTASMPRSSPAGRVAESPRSLGAARLRGRKSSQAEAAVAAPPALSHFSIAAVLKPTGASAQQQQAAAEGVDRIAAARPQQQQRQVSIHADATQQAAAERSGCHASTSGRPTGGGSGGADWLPAVRTRLVGMSLQHSGGSASVPLEAASPLRGGQGAQQAAAAAAAVLAASTQQEQQQQLAADDYHARGYALRKQGDFAGAVREYSRALALDPGHFKCLFNRAFSLDKVVAACGMLCCWCGEGRVGVYSHSAVGAAARAPSPPRGCLSS